VHCGVGSWGGQYLSMAPYVTETGAHEGATAGGGRSCCLSSRGLTRCAASLMIVASHHSR